GIVTNEKGEALSGVSVTVKGSSTGTATDAEGKFSLPTQGNKVTLVFSFVGYTARELVVSGSKNVNVTLLTATSQMGDVVVVGYGTKKKEPLTGSVASVKGAEVLKSPAINVSNSLAGRVPGLTVIGQGGEPGNDYSTILVRGLNTFQNSTPL